MKIGIFCCYDQAYKDVAEITLPVLSEYCDRHGYTLNVTQNPTILRTLIWDRIRTIQENLYRYDWVVRMDLDVLITNHAIQLEGFLDDAYNMILSGDYNGLNNGVMFFKGCRITAKFINKLWATTPYTSPNTDLAAICEWYENNPDQTLIKVVNQKLFNSYLYSAYPIHGQQDWEKGDFALHLPGMTSQRRVEIFTQIQKEIMR